jgi:hypothetical protein
MIHLADISDLLSIYSALCSYSAYSGTRNRRRLPRRFNFKGKSVILSLIALVASTPEVQLDIPDFSSLDTPQEMPSSWIGLYVPKLLDCSGVGSDESVAIERHGLHFYEAEALAQRIVWVDEGRELFMYGLLGGEGSVGPSYYRIRRAEDGKSITFYGGDRLAKISGSDDVPASIPGQKLLRCPG